MPLPLLVHLICFVLNQGGRGFRVLTTQINLAFYSQDRQQEALIETVEVNCR
jgi:hypothetical protein